MTISNFRAAEALYIVIVRDPGAEKQLREWAKQTNAQVVIEHNRMKIFEERSFSIFRMTWQGNLDSVTVWDTWNKRHIYI